MESYLALALQPCICPGVNYQQRQSRFDVWSVQNRVKSRGSCITGHYKVRKHASGACSHRPHFVGREGNTTWEYACTKDLKYCRRQFLQIFFFAWARLYSSLCWSVIWSVCWSVGLKSLRFLSIFLYFLSRKVNLFALLLLPNSMQQFSRVSGLV